MLAEDLLLLLTDDATGRSLVDTTRLDLALGGAILVGLTAAGRIRITGPGEDVRAGRVVVEDPAPTGDPVLDDGLGLVVASRRPPKPESLVPRLGKGVRARLYGRLADRGILRAEEGRILGIFPTRSWPAVDSAHEDELRRGLREVLLDGRRPDEAEVVVISLLHAVDQTPKVLADAGLPRRELKRRAKAIAEGEFAGAAVRRAVDAVNAAMVAAIAATAAASSS